jgi:hypothetical protein
MAKARTFQGIFPCCYCQGSCIPTVNLYVFRKRKPPSWKHRALRLISVAGTFTGKIRGAVIKLASQGLISTYIGQKMRDLQHDAARVWHQAHAVNYVFADAFAKLRKETINFVMSVHCLSVRTEKFGSHWRIFMKFYIWVFFENLSWKFNIY